MPPIYYPVNTKIVPILDSGESSNSYVAFTTTRFINKSGKYGYGLTACQLQVHGKKGVHDFFGLARLSPSDYYDLATGQRIALKRAVHQLYKAVLTNAAPVEVSEQELLAYFRKGIYNALVFDGTIKPDNEKAIPVFMRLDE